MQYVAPHTLTSNLQCSNRTPLYYPPDASLQSLETSGGLGKIIADTSGQELGIMPPIFIRQVSRHAGRQRALPLSW